MKVAVAQLNPVVGDVEGNVDRMIGVVKSHAGSCDLVVFPELSVTGYPPRDLLERRWFIRKVETAVRRLSASTADTRAALIFGAPVISGVRSGTGLYNAALFACGGAVKAVRPKTLLPSYDVFDEVRYFDAGDAPALLDFCGERIGVTVCEDAWNDPAMWPAGRRYTRNPVEDLASMGATLMVNISASPFEAGKPALRRRLISGHASRHRVPFIYVNQVGGNDELIFDGASLCVDRRGLPIHVSPSFQEHVAVVDTAAAGRAHEEFPVQGEAESICNALVLGVRDYLHKTGFKKAVVGLSGGIDSAVVCSIAVRALGAENVLGITMPSPYSSGGSVADSRALAANLGVELREIPISGVFQSYLDVLEPQFAGRVPDVTEENIQARIRGGYLMAFSNKYGYMVLSTGNKSEVAVGYCTLYGDMCGGLSVISDVPKTMVYRLAEWMNRDGAVIPRPTIEKPPSAELKPGQRDQDSLPPYDILDAILEYYVEDGLCAEEIEAKGQDRATVDWVIGTVNRNEYKRRQAATGLRVTSKAFGAGRRIPLAAKYW
ncbi:MAG: NAD+ synthase [Myxococcota bacterium]|jgi:NAD+ synthase (glutamine-hydrolysing)